MPVRKTHIKFTRDLRDSAEALEISAGKIIERLALGIGSRTIARTPVLTGALAANFQYSEGAPVRQPIEGLTATREQAQLMTLERAHALKFSRLGRYTLGNYLPYAERIEFEGWSHTKAPEGMLRLAIDEELAEFETFVAEIVRQQGLK